MLGFILGYIIISLILGLVYNEKGDFNGFIHATIGALFMTPIGIIIIFNGEKRRDNKRSLYFNKLRSIELYYNKILEERKNELKVLYNNKEISINELVDYTDKIETDTKFKIYYSKLKYQKDTYGVGEFGVDSLDKYENEQLETYLKDNKLDYKTTSEYPR